MHKKKACAGAPATRRGRLRPYRYLLLFNGLLLLLAGLLLAYIYLLYGLKFPFFCAFYEKFHLYCPGCGATRALLDLVRLRPLASFCKNPLVILGGGVMLFYEYALLRHARRGGRVREWPAIAYAASILFFFVLRNILLVCFHIDFLGDLLIYWS